MGPRPWKHPKERRRRLRHRSRGSARHGNTSTCTETVNTGAFPTATCCVPELGLVVKASEAGTRQREAARCQSKAPDRLENGVSKRNSPLQPLQGGDSEPAGGSWVAASFGTRLVADCERAFKILSVGNQCPLSRDTARGSQELSFPSCSLLRASKALRSLHVNSRHLSFSPYLSCRARCPTQGAGLCVCMSKELPSFHFKATEV